MGNETSLAQKTKIEQSFYTFLEIVFYLKKVPARSSPHYSTLPLTRALEWDTVLVCILTGIETMHGQILNF